MSLMISPAARDALEGWLASSRALNGTAENTLIAYRGFSDIAGPGEATFDEMLQSLVIHTD